MLAITGEKIAHRFFSGTGTTYDWMVDLATFGVDRWWEKRSSTRLRSRPGAFSTRPAVRAFSLSKSPASSPHAGLSACWVAQAIVLICLQKLSIATRFETLKPHFHGSKYTSKVKNHASFTTFLP
jgi:hypothetical protein